MIPKLFYKKNFLITLGTLFVLSAIFIYAIFDEIETHHKEHKSNSENLLLQEAVSLFESMVKVRKWNSLHGGVYVKKREGIEPNPYLKNNVLFTDKNETLIMINPAWMSRQINELINLDKNRYFKITSLNPINPLNTADKFETEALKYFTENKGEKYFYNYDVVDFDSSKNGYRSQKMFNFMGRLDTERSCLNCHAFQGYKEGDLRGGIRISLPLDKYIRSSTIEDESYNFSRVLIIFIVIMLLILILFVIYLFFREQKRLEVFNNLLEEDVKERTKELIELNSTLEERINLEVAKSQEKDQFIIAQSRHVAMGEMIAMIAHQWRQPISIIAMDASSMIIDMELGEIDDKTFRANLEGIIEQTDHLSNTIDDFRNFFRKEREKENVLPSDVVKECYEIIGASLKAHDIRYEILIEEEKIVNIYSRELLQIVLNIVNNAKDVLLEKKIEEPKIDIKISINGENTEISICDNGGGIPEDIISHIFEPYFSTKTKKDGTGLGLYMSKMIIDTNFNGKIDVSNNEDGACFTIIFS